jgi:peptide/nickel transport system substrate-binding protein
MPAELFRRALALLLAGLLAAVPSACRNQPEGPVKVLVIGDKLALRDPAQGALTPPEAVLLGNLAQGLVRFDAGGNIVGGLAERWNVSDDGLSYIFRIATAEWPDGRKITAHQIARILRRHLGNRSKNPLSDALGAVEEVVAMTDRVIEIRLRAPRPTLLATLAQPEFAILRNGAGTGPFRIVEDDKAGDALHLRREMVSAEGEVTARDDVLLGTATAEDAVRAFARGEAHLVLGGTFVDLPFVRAVRLPGESLRFDPVAGLFGLVPARADGPLADPELRALLSRAIDRNALIAALNVPGLAARATVLEPGLDGVPAPQQPDWFGVPLVERRPELVQQAEQLTKDIRAPVLRLFLPDGPGAEILLRRLSADWGALGFTVERAKSARTADLQLIDAVAPSTSSAWLLRSFRCGAVPVCDEDADRLLEAARAAPVPLQRYALLAQAAALIDEAQLFIPLAAPVRWSLVAPRIQGFAGNRYARHTLVGLERKPGAGDF